MSLYRELLPALILLLMFLIAFYAEPRISISEKNVNMIGGLFTLPGGEISKIALVYALPIIGLAIYIGLLVIPKANINRESYEGFKKQFWGFKVVLTFAMCVIYISLLLPSIGYWNLSDPTMIIIPAISMVFFYVGYMLNFTNKDYFVGIGTPWTLADEKIWERTNRLGGLLFWALGVVALVLLVAPLSGKLWLIAVLFGAVLVALYAYSLLEYLKTKRLRDSKKMKRKR